MIGRSTGHPWDSHLNVTVAEGVDNGHMEIDQRYLGHPSICPTAQKGSRKVSHDVQPKSAHDLEGLSKGDGECTGE